MSSNDHQYQQIACPIPDIPNSTWEKYITKTHKFILESNLGFTMTYRNNAECVYETTDGLELHLSYRFPGQSRRGRVCRALFISDGEIVEKLRTRSPKKLLSKVRYEIQDFEYIHEYMSDNSISDDEDYAFLFPSYSHRHSMLIPGYILKP